MMRKKGETPQREATRPQQISEPLTRIVLFSIAVIVFLLDARLELFLVRYFLLSSSPSLRPAAHTAVGRRSRTIGGMCQLHPPVQVQKIPKIHIAGIIY